VLKNIATGKAETVLLSSDASPRTCSKFKEACEDSDVTILTLTFTKQVLGRAIGRDDTAVVAVTDNSFAKKIIEIAGDGAENPVAGGK
jgi:ribosomal protein L7Ae-like RNA K-turn-binding protein